MSSNNGITTPTLRHDEMHPDEHNVRADAERNVEELAFSIAEVGVLSPLAINRSTGKIVAGHRRHAAIGHLISEGMLSKSYPIPVHYVDVAESATNSSIQMMLIENLQREDLNPVEEANAISELKETYQLTQAEVAARIGKSASLVSHRLQLLRLPEHVLDALVANTLTLDQCQAMVPLAKHEDLIAQVLDMPAYWDSTKIESLVDKAKLAEKVERILKWIEGAGSTALTDYDDLTAANRVVNHDAKSLTAPTKAEIEKFVKKSKVYWVRGRYDGDVVVMETTVLEPEVDDKGEPIESPKSSALEKDNSIKEAMRKRNAAIAELVSETSFTVAQVNTALVLFLLEHCPEQTFKTACRLLGITEFPQKETYGGHMENDYETAVAEVIEKGGVESRRAAMALIMVKLNARHGAHHVPKDDSPITQLVNMFDLYLDAEGGPVRFAEDNEEGTDDD